MNDVQAVLDRWSLEDEPRDWQEVLARASQGRARRRRSLAAALAVVAALLTVPALGLADDVRELFGDDRPRLAFGATLRGPNGVAGRLELEAQAALLIRPGRRTIVPLVRPDSDGKFRPAARQPFRWMLTLRDGSAAEASIVRRGRVLVRLCNPCATDASGAFRISRHEAFALLNGGASAEVRTTGGTLRGRIVFDRG